MLALSAVFAVVISTISMPGDGATAQATDLAEAWWGQLSDEQRLNVLAGKGSDEVGTADGRQYFRTTYNLSTYSTGANLTVTATSTHLAYANLNSTTTNTVDDYADGDTTDIGDIYAVGEQDVLNGQAIRGFQSVELWWNHLTCEEARTVVGEDNGSLLTSFGSPAALEPSDVCEFPDNTSVGSDTPATTKAYSDLSATVKTQVNQVGNALLGLTNGGTYNASDNAMAKRWWGKLSGASESPHRTYALYGDSVTTIPAAVANADNTAVMAQPALIASQEYDDITTSLTFTVDVSGTATALPLDDASKALVPQVKALINDRAMLVYGSGGTGGKYEGVDAWWDSIGCLEKWIAVGADNEPGTAGSGFCQKFDNTNDDRLNDDQNRDAGPPRTVSDRERAMTAGRALLGLDDIPAAAAWWDTLNATQMVNVVYGDPLEMEGDPAAPKASAEDRNAFQQMYANLGTVRVVASDLPDVMIADTSGLLKRHNVPTEEFDHDDDPGTSRVEGYLVKHVVDAIATEIFDPPHAIPGAYRTPDVTGQIVNKDNEFIGTGLNTRIANNQPDDDNEFDPPYQSVGDWWENLDCRLMRLAVGEDNDYLAVDTDAETTGSQNEVSAGGYCAHYPGSLMSDGTTPYPMSAWLSVTAQARVDQVGKALLARSEIGRPSFNEAATGDPTISGTPQVGATLTANTGAIDDVDGVGDVSYQWMRTTNPTVDIPGATGRTYTLTAADAGATISVRVSFMDGERYPETTTSAGTSVVVGSPGRISKIEPGIRGVVVSGGENLTLTVDVYGVQGDVDQSLAAQLTLMWSVSPSGGSLPADTVGNYMTTYTASSSPGTYTVTARVSDGDCKPSDESMRDSACSASFEVKVKRPSAPQPEPVAPSNPPGDIPTILTDSDGNQYEVFTPVEGGTFAGEGYSIMASSGAVPNGEFIGVRMSDDGSASNAGMTHQRYTLGGNMYGVHVVDSAGASVSDYVLDEAAKVCVPLPNTFRARISDLALVTINSDGSLTILAANVRLGDGGDASVCGNLSNLPASAAVGSMGAPAAIPTATPIPTPVPPETGGSAPSSNGMLWALLLGTAILLLGAIVVLTTRRSRKSLS